MIKGELTKFSIRGVNGITHASFEFETEEGKIVKHDEEMRFENQEDVKLMYDMQNFVYAKMREGD